MRITHQWRRARTERERLLAKAERNNVYIITDRCGHIVAVR